MLESHLHRDKHFSLLYLDEFLTTSLALEEPFFDTLPCNKGVLQHGSVDLTDFLGHRKHIVIFTHSGNISIPNQVCYCLLCIFYLTLGSYVLILDDFDPFITICDGKLILSLDPDDRLLIPSCRSAVAEYVET